MNDGLSRSATGVARAAYVAAALNLVAGLAMLLILLPGLPTEGSLIAERARYVTTEVTAWRVGWLLWHAAAIALLGFYVGLARRWWREAPILGGLALLCGAAGLAADLTAEALYMALAPGADTARFAEIERVAGLLTGYIGNGLYTVAGILITIAGARELPRALLARASVVWLAGLALSASTLLDLAVGQFWSTAILMPAFVLWAALVGRWLSRRAS